jgi:hypothetical protein
LLLLCLDQSSLLLLCKQEALQSARDTSTHPHRRQPHPCTVRLFRSLMASTPPTPHLPDPGQVLHLDFRPAPSTTPAPARPGLRLVQWNIERGYQLPSIIQQLQELDADIISLQEVQQNETRRSSARSKTCSAGRQSPSCTCRCSCRWTGAVNAAVARTQALPLPKL